MELKIKKVRNRRAWRRYYYPGRPMLWRRRMVYEGQEYGKGDPIPDSMHADKGLLRRFAFRGIIGFAPEAAAEPAEPVLPDPPVLAGGDESGDPEPETGAAASGEEGGDESGDPEGGDLTTDSPALPDPPVLDTEPPAPEGGAEVG